MSRLPILSIILICSSVVDANFAAQDEPIPAANTQQSIIANDSALLSPEERKWLFEHQRIRIGITVIPPQVLHDKGNYKGLSIDYIHLMEHKLNYRFELVPYATWKDVIQAAKTRQIDMIFAAQQTPDRLTYLQFSKPYIELPNMILVRNDRTGGSSLNDMKDWRVAVSEGSAVHEYLRNTFRDLNIVPVRDELAGLIEVSMGEVDAMVIEVSRASYYIDKAGIMNLRVSGNADFLYQLRFAVRSDWPILTGILDKGLSSITEQERQNINQRWIFVNEKSVFASRVFWISLGTVTLIVVAVVVWNQTLRRLVKKRTEQLRHELAERKHAEAQLRQYRDNLEETVQQRTKELLLARDAAEAANKAKSVFLANMSHELRTPLNAILGFSSMMKRDPLITAKQYENLGIINRSGEHLLNLINDILEIAKIESRRQQLDLAAFDLDGMLAEVSQMMQVRAREKDLGLTIDRSPELPRYINSNQVCIRQILINLINNAIKFTLHGNVTVRIGIEKIARQYLSIEVEDTGPGIAPQDQQRLFEPFVQLTGSGVQYGTGLGLTVTRQFVRMLDGKISVDSTPGKGSLFRVELPVEPASSAEIVTPKTEPYSQVIGLAPGQARYRILIVEDQYENRLLLNQLMTELGLETKTAENGEQCLTIFRDWQPDLIWMDRRMPVMDGMEATKRLRELPNGQNVKVIAVSASVFKEEQQEMLDAGMDDFVRKPYHFDEIYECLARQLNIEYLYQSAEPIIGTRSTELRPDMLVCLPSELREQLIEALEILDSDRIDAVIRLIGEKDVQLGQALSGLAEQFDYTTILKSLDMAD